MAGDWIKMRNDLADDPAVIKIAARLNLDEFAVVGRLHRLWSWADRQTTDGNALGVTEAWIDRYTSTPGFTAALIAVGWLTLSGDGITFPKFGRHNGESAKKRALTAKRVAKHKAGNAQANADANATGNAVSVSFSLPEKRREEKSSSQVSKPEKRGSAAGASGVPIPVELDTPEFREAWGLWLRHRSERTPKYTATAAEAQLKRLVGIGASRAAIAASHSTAQGWQGIYEPKGDHHPRPGPGFPAQPIQTPEDDTALIEKELAKLEQQRRRA